MAEPENVAGSARWLTAAMLAAAVAFTVPGISTAGAPSRTPHSDPQARDRQPREREQDDRTPGSSDRLAEAQSRLADLNAQVELKMEEANKARVDLRRAERAAADARRAASAAAAESAAAARHLEEQRRRLDEFAARSYRHGSKIGSLTAFFGSQNPQDVIDRAELLDVVSRSELDVLDRLEQARIEKAKKDSSARQAADDAEAKRVAAEQARKHAEDAENAAVAAQAAQAGRTQRLEDDLAGMQAEPRPAGAGAPAAPAGDGRGGGVVETVIQRALAQLGIVYAWGGGDSAGPTRGIRDGGVADSFGDYQKVGFDCSGLMLYAFAGVGVELDHYSGYQYESGRKVPLADMRRGDMLFWQDGRSTHHVALYLGDGLMVEAPFSGARVRVTPVRYDGIAPYAVRVL